MLALRADPATPRFFVLRCGTRVGGAISLRFLGGDLVLDNLSVEPELRARFRGVQLMAESIATVLAEAQAGVVVSDVFAGRPALAKFHRSIGGIEQTARGWWIGPVETGGAVPSARIAGLLEADRQHSRWGFSSFIVRTTLAEYKVGRLPGPYFRLTDPHGANDMELIRALRSLDPERKLFLIGPADSPGPGWEQAALLRRFIAPAETMLRALRQFLAPAEEVTAHASASLGN
jgi:hypothetical protein